MVHILPDAMIGMGGHALAEIVGGERVNNNLEMTHKWAFHQLKIDPLQQISRTWLGEPRF